MIKKISVGDRILFQNSGEKEEGVIIDTVSYPEIGRILDVITDKGEEVVKEADVIRKIKSRAV